MATLGRETALRVRHSYFARAVESIGMSIISTRQFMFKAFLCSALTASLTLTPAHAERTSVNEASAASEIWLGPQALPPPLPAAVDYMDMFKPDAPWKVAAVHVQVFMLPGAFVTHTSPEQLNTVVTDLKNRGMAIALAVGVMNVPHNPASGCGGLGNVEGYGTVPMATKISRMIKNAGGEIKYLVMDEPLFYGHYYTRAQGKGNGCHSSIDEIIQLIKPTLSVYTQEFPNIFIGEVEPTFFIDGHANWRRDLSAWAAAYRAAMRKPLAFMHLDIEWPLANGVQDALQVYNAAQELVRQHLVGKIGVIYNGSRQNSSDVSWVKAARDHVLLLEGKYRLRPDHVIFQSWTTNPTHAMPETAPDTLTSLVDFYFSPTLRGQIEAR